MSKPSNKRYLITFTEDHISPGRAGALLGLPQPQFQRAITAALTGEAEPDAHLHFADLGISVMSMAPSEAEALGKREGILAVEEDFEMSILGALDTLAAPTIEVTASADAPLWNMMLVKAPKAWANGYKGQGTKVAILDTGIATHPDLVIAGGTSFVPGEPSYLDEHGHGTHCAGIVAGQGNNSVWGVAPGCGLYAVKVLSKSGSGSSSWIISGMQWCISNGIQVASMSLGSMSTPSLAWATAIRRCQTQGLTVVCAAGNSYQTAFPWVNAPANSSVSSMQNESPVAVAAIDQTKAIAPFSSQGAQTTPWNQVTVSAPGVSIYSTYLNNGYTTMSGTSMACPHVAGLAALIYQRYGTITPQLVQAKISSTAANLGSSPYPNVPFGYGLIDCDAATR